MPLSHIPKPHLSSSRWFGISRRVSGDESEDNQIFSTGAGGECYACTQVGVPVFHSTSCDGANQPEWEASAGSSLLPIKNRAGQKPSGDQSRSGRGRRFWSVLDPRSKRVQRWNRAFLLARGLALAVDPLFFYSLSIGRGGSQRLYLDAGLAVVATVLRTGVDTVHLCHLWLQFRLAYVSRESLVIGCGKLVWDARAVAVHYLRSLRGFWFDVFVILPVPQTVFWLVVPRLIKENQIRAVMTILLLIFLFQFLPKVYHSICLMRRMQKVTGYIFGTIWWGFGLNLIAYFIASHVAGGCWYVLAIQRVASCLKQQCRGNQSCNISVCLDVNGPYQYGIYKWALPVVSSSSIAVKILYPIFWGLMTLSTFGNDLEPTSQGLEVLFSISAVLSGLMLFTLLIGNIQVFLHAVMAKKRKMQLRCRDMEWWMKRRQLPSQLRQRVRRYERHRWLAVGGADEMDIIKDLPEGLRRDIKRFLCLDLIKQVPLFHSLDELILDNICDRVKPILISKDEKATFGVLRVVEMGLKLSKKGTKSPDSNTNTSTSVQYVQSQLVNCLWKNYIRNLVSKKRRRMLVAGYDLDMTYITDRILAMSFPAERMRAMYRNPLWQVKSVLELSHRGHYKVYNLCIEEDYDPLHFNGCVERYPFDDNHVPPLSMMKEFCEDVHSWLASDPKNIAVVHCMAGKGRTGLMVSSYLAYTGMSAEKALQVYAEKRTTNNEGVSIASQRRYVAYWEKAISCSQVVDFASPCVNLPPPCTRELQHIRLYDTVNINQVFVVVNQLQEIPGQRYRPPVEVSKTCCRRIGTDNEKSYESRYYYSFVESDEGRKDAEEEPHLVVQMDTESSIIYQKTCLGHHYEKPLRLTGDVRIIFYEKLIGGRIFYVCFNTAFITGSLLQFTIKDLDKVGQKGRSVCGPSFCLELFFGPSNANNCLMPPNDEL